jgi:hypothetical protein
MWPDGEIVEAFGGLRDKPALWAANSPKALPIGDAGDKMPTAGCGIK